ncbi:AraC family transcriptional regulator [Rhizobium rhizoryzae]|uniref:AraC family transcriptional regulator n=1 Tax=Rhizobium rhizoryzae TaxID=451876 RepID=UPI0028B01680|nr:AraC family transcriptional regulator [Rhizobium rhizoryzae]
MTTAPASNQSMEYFRARQQDVLIAPVFGKSEISMARLSCMKPGHGVIDPPVHEDAFFLAFNLLDYDGDLWVDGKKVVTKRSKSGNFTIYDHRRTWLADMKSSFDGLGFHIPRTALAAYEEDLGGKHVDTLHAPPGKDIEDDVVRGLVRACIPVLTDRCNATKMFQDHIAAILTFHLCATYGNASIRKPVQGVLAPWQKKRAVEMLEADLAADLPLAAVAAACGLSQGYFTRAFRLSTGHPPYRWVVLKRVERAKELLRLTDITIAEVAFVCGFCDQAHLTRMFAAKVGMTPAQWRRASR